MQIVKFVEKSVNELPNIVHVVVVHHRHDILVCCELVRKSSEVCLPRIRSTQALVVVAQRIYDAML